MRRMSAAGLALFVCAARLHSQTVTLRPVGTTTLPTSASTGLVWSSIRNDEASAEKNDASERLALESSAGAGVPQIGVREGATPTPSVAPGAAEETASPMADGTGAWFQSEDGDDRSFATFPAQYDGAPLPLAQVLAALCRRAQVRFVDPGIPASETIAYQSPDDGEQADAWTEFTQIAQARGYRIVHRDNVVTLVRAQQDFLKPAPLVTKRFKVVQGNAEALFLQLQKTGWNQVPFKQLALSRNSRELIATGPQADLDALESTVRSRDFNPHNVRAEVWLQNAPKGTSPRDGLAVVLADLRTAPEGDPLMSQSLELGNDERFTLADAQTERGESQLRLTINAVLLPNGNLEANLTVENAAPVPGRHKHRAAPGSLRRACSHVVELAPGSQLVQVDGVLPPEDATARSRPWYAKLVPWPRGGHPANERLTVRFTVDGPTPGTPAASTDSVRIAKRK